MDILTLNWFVSLGAALMQIGALALVGLYIARDPRVHAFIARIALPLSSLVAVVGLVMSLVYSEHFGVIPCGLCWMERVFLYPLAFILPLAWYRNEKSIALYGIVLSGIGALIALYHHYLQMTGGSNLPCPASGAGDCAKRIIFEFGYITFPLIAFSSFIFIIALLLFVIRDQKSVATSSQPNVL